ncbi:hypothetical protein AwErysi_04490 [Erysipelotrichaceae bacterium]|nr:hypothetical protein AwErysi_04490 [Erysipelotrichaceae bacterium]
MKNIKPILIGILTFTLLCSFGVNYYQFVANGRLNSEIIAYEDKYSPMYEYFSSLSIKEFEEKVAAGDEFTVYFGRPDCSDCTYFEPSFIQTITTKNLEDKLYYVNVKWLRAGDKIAWDSFKQKYQFTQTPAFSKYKDGKQIGLIEWTDKGLTQAELIIWLEQNQEI